MMVLRAVGGEAIFGELPVVLGEVLLDGLPH
jgi:hypothetical protein